MSDQEPFLIISSAIKTIAPRLDNLDERLKELEIKYNCKDCKDTGLCSYCDGRGEMRVGVKNQGIVHTLCKFCKKNENVTIHGSKFVPRGLCGTCGGVEESK